MKRRFLICFPYEGDVSKINRIADALENEGIDFVQVNESFTDGTPDTTIARGDIEEVKREIKEEVVEEKVVENKEVFKEDDFVYGYEPGMNRWLPYIVKEELGDDKYLVYNYQVGAPYQTEDEVFEMYGEDLRKQPEGKYFLVQDYLYFNDGKNFEDYVKENSNLIKDIYIDSMSGTVDIEWNDPAMKGYLTQATPFWEEEDYVPVQVTTEDGDIIDESGELNLKVYFEEYDDLDFDNSIYPNSPSSFYQAYVDILPMILQTSKKLVKMYEERKFAKGGSVKEIEVGNVFSLYNHQDNKMVDVKVKEKYKSVLGRNTIKFDDVDGEELVMSEDIFRETLRNNGYEKYAKGGMIEVVEYPGGSILEVSKEELKKLQDKELVFIDDDYTYDTDAEKSKYIGKYGYREDDEDEIEEILGRDIYAKGGELYDIMEYPSGSEFTVDEEDFKKLKSKKLIYPDDETGWACNEDDYEEISELIGQEYAKGGEINKDNKALITGGLAGILLGIFLNR